jgi:hypothetical protein
VLSSGPQQEQITSSSGNRRFVLICPHAVSAQYAAPKLFQLGHSGSRRSCLGDAWPPWANHVGLGAEEKNLEATDFSMDSAGAGRSMPKGQRPEGRKLYRPPRFTRLSTDAAKEVLLRRADSRDPDVQHMLDRVRGLQGKTCGET